MNKKTQVWYWNKCLSDEEIALLGKGTDPDTISPGALVWYREIPHEDFYKRQPVNLADICITAET